jgi:three-Cys-motif partner protein
MRSVEIFLNFMVMDMNMNILLNNPEKADPTQVARMTRFWGDDSWHSVAYEEDPQRHLFGDPVMVKVEDANDKVAEAYRRRLLKVAGFKFSPVPLRFVNARGATIYYLFFASPDPTANSIVTDIFAKHRKRQAL